MLCVFIQLYHLIKLVNRFEIKSSATKLYNYIWFICCFKIKEARREKDGRRGRIFFVPIQWCRILSLPAISSCTEFTLRNPSLFLSRSQIRPENSIWTRFSFAFAFASTLYSTWPPTTLTFLRLQRTQTCTNQIEWFVGFHLILFNPMSGEAARGQFLIFWLNRNLFFVKYVFVASGKFLWSYWAIIELDLTSGSPTVIKWSWDFDVEARKIFMKIFSNLESHNFFSTEPILSAQFSWVSYLVFFQKKYRFCKIIIFFEEIRKNWYLSDIPDQLENWCPPQEIS